MAASNCEHCNNYVYDDECECWFCDMNLDEDEMLHFLTGDYRECPYYRSDDDYEIVRRQN